MRSADAEHPTATCIGHMCSASASAKTSIATPHSTRLSVCPTAMGRTFTSVPAFTSLLCSATSRAAAEYYMYHRGSRALRYSSAKYL